MNVAITGASGHIGAAVCRHLVTEGHNVRVFVRQPCLALQHLPLEPVLGELEDPDSLDRLCAGAQIVFHLAGQISIGSIPERRLQEINVGGTRRVIAACQKQGVQRLVHFSSAHAYAVVPRHLPFDESAPPATAFPYERSKANAQALVLAANQPGALETVCLNPTAVLGPWDTKPSLQGKMLLDLWQGKIPVLTPGGYDWVDSRDVAQAAVAAMTLAIPGEAYLLSGHYARILDIAAMLGRITGRRMPDRSIPFWLLHALVPAVAAWSRLSGTEPLFTHESIAHVQGGHPRVSHAKATQQLQFHPRPLEETLRDTWDWLHTYWIKSKS